MRTLGSDGLSLGLGNNCCFPECFFCDRSPRRFKRALKPLGLVFLTACFAAYLSHTFQSDMCNMKCAPGKKGGLGPDGDPPAFRSFSGMDDDGYESKERVNDKVKSEKDLTTSIKSIKDDLDGLKSLVKAGMNPEALKQTEDIIKKHLQIYDADKTGITDYALEKLGACIVSVRNTVTYKEGTPLLTIFGYPLLTVLTEPKNIIEPKVNPGDCWAIKGDTGTAVIKLIRDIVVTAITIEHIPRSISPTGDISSAPKRITLLGLESLNDRNPHCFGQFEYNEEGPAIQTFVVKVPCFKTFRLVEVMIDSNHGNPKFTCIYRIRIHGRPPPESLAKNKYN
ncbi:klaroid protein isoform X2 [Halyomorpha halys]|uniref:klaroid protein isoform X2 n=1 Tax=Halyomorpha halys TaxID=286706 RepID=UPI0006D4C9AA|nr:SUN domain-containing protein 2-like isoform X1 [Halyomorpha halys]XP_014285870.1 SUN domain-containing protein 2-like isoform X1 [Halyomorpha halys]XP_014285871.1 SUN domain-containing protein 2-like isoform X1 [Halyomorpha halys]